MRPHGAFLFSHFNYLLGFRNLTPGPPPFSGMNSTPANSRVERTASTVRSWSFSPVSSRTTVFAPTRAAAAKSITENVSAARDRWSFACTVNVLGC